jgi:hypothetical protein
MRQAEHRQWTLEDDEEDDAVDNTEGDVDSSVAPIDPPLPPMDPVPPPPALTSPMNEYKDETPLSTVVTDLAGMKEATALEDEADPLDAFMESLTAEGGFVEQVRRELMSVFVVRMNLRFMQEVEPLHMDSSAAESKVDDARKRGHWRVNPYGTNTIYLEDIQTGKLGQVSCNYALYLVHTHPCTE